MTAGERGGSRGWTTEQEVALRYQAKAELRKRLRGIRRAVPAEKRRERSGRIDARLRSLDAWKAAHTVAGYVAMRGEVDPGPTLEAALEEGKRVVLPRASWETETMELHRVEVFDDLEESGMGFLQPPSKAPRVPPEEVDLVVVPALAADERGYRIGWGKGFYDRLLPTMPKATRVAVVFDFQVLAEVPETPGDEPVDFVVSDVAIIETGRRT